jgi:hypothetical protein
VGLFFSHSSTADLTCTSEWSCSEVCTTSLETVGNLTTVILLVCEVSCCGSGGIVMYVGSSDL